MEPDARKDVKQSCDFAIVCSYLENFGVDLGVQLTFPQLTNFLVNFQSACKSWTALHERLLSRVRFRTKLGWEKALVRFCSKHDREDENILSEVGYNDLPWTARLRILLRLLECQFDLNTKFKAKVDQIDIKKLHSSAVGTDRLGRVYWIFLDKDYNFLLYRENTEDDSLLMMCDTIDGLEELLNSLRDPAKLEEGDDNKKSSATVSPSDSDLEESQRKEACKDVKPKINGHKESSLDAPPKSEPTSDTEEITKVKQEAKDESLVNEKEHDADRNTKVLQIKQEDSEVELKWQTETVSAKKADELDNKTQKNKKDEETERKESENEEKFDHDDTVTAKENEVIEQQSVNENNEKSNNEKSSKEKPNEENPNEKNSNEEKSKEDKSAEEKSTKEKLVEEEKTEEKTSEVETEEKEKESEVKEKTGKGRGKSSPTKKSNGKAKAAVVEEQLDTANLRRSSRQRKPVSFFTIESVPKRGRGDKNKEEDKEEEAEDEDESEEEEKKRNSKKRRGNRKGRRSSSSSPKKGREKSNKKGGGKAEKATKKAEREKKKAERERLKAAKKEAMLAKKKKLAKKRKKKKGNNPWDRGTSSDEQDADYDEQAFLNYLQEDEEEDEASLSSSSGAWTDAPESDFDPNMVDSSEDEAALQKRGRNFARSRTRTPKNLDPVTKAKCAVCDSGKMPEWILLCDKCDAAYHALCLRPPLMLIPEGDWFCPVCQHAALIEQLEERYKQITANIKKADTKLRMKERLNFVNISLSNIISSNSRRPGKSKTGQDDDFDSEEDMGEEREDYDSNSGSSRGSGSSCSESDSGSESETESESDDEPRRMTRQRKSVKYTFDEFDERINEAIGDDDKYKAVKEEQSIGYIEESVPLPVPPNGAVTNVGDAANVPVPPEDIEDIEDEVEEEEEVEDDEEVEEEEPLPPVARSNRDRDGPGGKDMSSILGPNWKEQTSVGRKPPPVGGQSRRKRQALDRLSDLESGEDDKDEDFKLSEEEEEEDSSNASWKQETPEEDSDDSWMASRRRSKRTRSGLRSDSRRHGRSKKKRSRSEKRKKHSSSRGGRSRRRQEDSDEEWEPYRPRRAASRAVRYQFSSSESEEAEVEAEGSADEDGRPVVRRRRDGPKAKRRKVEESEEEYKVEEDEEEEEEEEDAGIEEGDEDDASEDEIVRKAKKRRIVSDEEEMESEVEKEEAKEDKQSQAEESKEEKRKEEEVKVKVSDSQAKEDEERVRRAVAEELGEAENSLDGSKCEDSQPSVRSARSEGAVDNEEPSDPENDVEDDDVENDVEDEDTNDLVLPMQTAAHGPGMFSLLNMAADEPSDGQLMIAAGPAPSEAAPQAPPPQQQPQPVYVPAMPPAATFFEMGNAPPVPPPASGSGAGSFVSVGTAPGAFSMTSLLAQDAPAEQPSAFTDFFNAPAIDPPTPFFPPGTEMPPAGQAAAADPAFFQPATTAASQPPQP